MMDKNKSIINDWKILVVASLTLGLAPFVPEPHIFGKIRWILGGGQDMKLMDYGDFFMHAIPFILLIRLGVLTFINKNKKNTHEIPMIKHHKQ